MNIFQLLAVLLFKRMSKTSKRIIDIFTVFAILAHNIIRDQAQQGGSGSKK